MVVRSLISIHIQFSTHAMRYAFARFLSQLSFHLSAHVRHIPSQPLCGIPYVTGDDSIPTHAFPFRVHDSYGVYGRHARALLPSMTPTLRSTQSQAREAVRVRHLKLGNPGQAQRLDAFQYEKSLVGDDRSCWMPDGREAPETQRCDGLAWSSLGKNTPPPPPCVESRKPTAGAQPRPTMR